MGPGLKADMRCSGPGPVLNLDGYRGHVFFAKSTEVTELLLQSRWVCRVVLVCTWWYGVVIYKGKHQQGEWNKYIVGKGVEPVYRLRLLFVCAEGRKRVLGVDSQCHTHC